MHLLHEKLKILKLKVTKRNAIDLMIPDQKLHIFGMHKPRSVSRLLYSADLVSLV